MSFFAALALLPESSKWNETSLKGRDGVILLFNASDPVPIFTWSVQKVKIRSVPVLAMCVAQYN
jgi:NET1-associated nuclear protein 1 (U3 small nucleolar RNA-associated protein 17)